MMLQWWELTSNAITSTFLAIIRIQTAETYEITESEEHTNTYCTQKNYLRTNNKLRIKAKLKEKGKNDCKAAKASRYNFNIFNKQLCCMFSSF